MSNDRTHNQSLANVSAKMRLYTMATHKEQMCAYKTDDIVSSFRLLQFSTIVSISNYSFKKYKFTCSLQNKHHLHGTCEHQRATKNKQLCDSKIRETNNRTNKINTFNDRF